MNSTSVFFGRAALAGALLWFAGLPAERANAATNVVLAGENLQTRIDAAASGDVMVIQSGAYGGTITISKALTLVRSGTEDVQFQGPVTINTAGAVALSQLRFADVVNISGGALVSVQESRFQGAVGATGGKLTLRKSEITGELRLTNTALTGLRLTNQSSVTATAAPNAGVPVVLSQCQLFGMLEATGYRMHLGYSKCLGVWITDGEAVLVGLQIRKTGYGHGMRATRSRLEVKNSDVDSSLYGGYNYELTYGVGIYESEASLENCLITCHSYYWNPPHNIASGIYIEGSGSKVNIVGCILSSKRDDGGAQGEEIRCVGQGNVVVSYSCVFNNSVYGVTTHQTLFTDPKLATDRTLDVDSPCRNAGPPDAIYNDRDGTRNDIGFTGGPLYNPANYTTDFPIAFWLNTTPRKVLKGINNTIRVDAAATAGH